MTATGTRSRSRNRALVTGLAGIILALAVTLFSCARNRVDSELRGAVVRIEPDSDQLERTAEVTRFKVNVIIRNDRATQLYFGGCGPEAQQEINGQWQTVWTPICVSPGSGSLAPSDSLMFPFTAARFANLVMEPHLDPRATAGRYRLQFGATYSGPMDYGLIYSGSTKPPPEHELSVLRSPVFIVY